LISAGVEDDPCGELPCQQLAGDHQAILSGHANVQNEDIGPVPARGRQGFLTPGAACHQFEILLEPEEVLHTVQDNRVIVGYYNSNGHVSSFSPESSR